MHVCAFCCLNVWLAGWLAGRPAASLPLCLSVCVLVLHQYCTEQVSEAATASGTPRGVLGPHPGELGSPGKRKAAILKPMPPPRLLGGASRTNSGKHVCAIRGSAFSESSWNPYDFESVFCIHLTLCGAGSRGQVVLGGIGVGSRVIAQEVVGIKAAPPTATTSATQLSARAHFQGRPVSLSRAGYGFEMKDPAPVLLDPGTTAGGISSTGGEGGSGGGSGRMKQQKLGAKRMGVSARGPHSVRAHSRGRESTAVASSVG